MQRIGSSSPVSRHELCRDGVFEFASRATAEPSTTYVSLSETRESIRTSIGMSVATDPFDRANRPTESTVERYACEDTPKDGVYFD